nr:MAG TPA: hypothetical protein [Caudoviricetes sp.]
MPLDILHPPCIPNFSQNIPSFFPIVKPLPVTNTLLTNNK